MKATSTTAAALAALLAAGGALAADNSVREKILEALESQATLPARRPTLPDRAREVQSSIALGEKGSAEQAANRAAQAARSDSATDAARKAAATAADRAGQKSQAAASERRAEEVRGGQPPSKPKRNNKKSD